MTRLSHEEVEAIRKRLDEDVNTNDGEETAAAYVQAFRDRRALLADRDAMVDGTVDEIAAIVCKHVPPVRFCDRGATCPCWAEYAVPAAKAILARFQLVQVPPSTDVV